MSSASSVRPLFCCCIIMYSAGQPKMEEDTPAPMAIAIVPPSPGALWKAVL